MCVIVGVVSISGSMSCQLVRPGVIILTEMAVAPVILYLVAKKRQWAMSETIRRSARRVSQIIWTTMPSSPRMSKAIPVNESQFMDEVRLMSDDEIRQPALNFQNILDLEDGIIKHDLKTDISSIRIKEDRSS